MKLYEIDKAYLDVIQDLDTEDDEQMKSDIMEQMDGLYEDKAAAVAAHIKNLEADVNAIDAAIKAMQVRLKSKKGQHEFYKSYLKGSMERTDHLKIERPEFVISVKKNPVAVQVDIDRLDGEFMVAKTTHSPNKKALKEALEDGREIDGATLIQNTSLQIK